MDWKNLCAEQLAQLKSDAERFDFPEDVVGRKFSIHTPKGMTAGLITGLVYGDDGLPCLQVSNPTYRSWRVDRLMPVVDQKGVWTMTTRSLDGKERQDYDGFLIIS